MPARINNIAQAREGIMNGFNSGVSFVVWIIYLFIHYLLLLLLLLFVSALYPILNAAGHTVLYV